MLELKPGSKAVLGFSGGIDSVVLSQFLLDRYHIRPICCTLIMACVRNLTRMRVGVSGMLKNTDSKLKF